MLKKSLLKALIVIGAISSLPILSSIPSNNACCTTSCNAGCENPCDTSCACPCSGKTFFFNRPLFQSYRPELWAGFRNDVMMQAADGSGGALDIVVYGGQSTKGSGLAQYFLPNCKNVLSVKENITTDNLADLAAENFGIITANGNFESVITFCAKHTEAGVGLHWKQGFAFTEESNSCAENQWWYLDIDLPITYVKNQFTISETVINDGGGVNTAVAASGIPVSPDMTAGMMQGDWLFGKVSNCCNLSKTGIADMEIKLGRQFVYNDTCLLAGYFGVLVPTGNSPCSQFVFEPVIGHGKHVGVIWGAEGGYLLGSNCDRKWEFWLDYAAQCMFLFQHCEIRSFDLKNRPWSRYILMYANQTQALQANQATDANIVKFLSTPGINLLTQCVQVTPGFQTNSTVSLVFQHQCGFEGEVGWNAFYRSAECVNLNWKTGPAIKAVDGDGATNPVLDISDTPLLADISVPFADYNASLIEQSDIDIQSAAHPNIIVQLLYTQLGYRWEDRCNPIHFGAGVSYEFAMKNFAVMNRWTLWGKFTVAF